MILTNHDHHENLRALIKLSACKPVRSKPGSNLQVYSLYSPCIEKRILGHLYRRIVQEGNK